MDRIKKLKIKKQDGTFSDYVPIGADAENIDFENGYSLDEIVGDINPDEDGTLEVQLAKLKHAECIFDPNDYTGTELQKLQAATDAAVNYIVTEAKTASVILDKIYNFEANDTLVIKKPILKPMLRFNGINGGGFALTQDKNINGINLLTLDNGTSYTMGIDFFGVSFYGNNRTGVLLHSPTFLNVYFTNCTFVDWPQICYTETYIQNIRLLNCDIRGGRYNLFEVGGLYDLHISHCTIEHRSGEYIIHQMNNSSKTGNPKTYNGIFYCSINHCLIEGFSATNESGIMKLEGGTLEFCEFIDNYVESMHNYIQLNRWTGGAGGQFIIERNRFFQGSSAHSDAIITCFNINYGTITFRNNRVGNIACFDFKNGLNASSRNIYFEKNKLTGNTNFSSNGEWSFEASATNLPWNVVPLIPLSSTNINDHCQYERYLPIVTDNHIVIYFKNYRDNDDDELIETYSNNAYITIDKGIMVIHRRKEVSLETGANLFKIATGIPIYIDEDINTNLYYDFTNRNITLDASTRNGTYFNKYAYVKITNHDETTYSNNIYITLSITLTDSIAG